MDARLESRAEVLRGFDATRALVAELLAYGGRGFGDATIVREVRFPLADEPFVEAWRAYSVEAAAADITVLADRLVQLAFPIAEGISESEEYRAVTQRGEPSSAASTASGLALSRPAECRITVHPTWAGAIPVIQTGCRDDFVSLIRAFTRRNELAPIPASMGACLVSGYHNWDRCRQLERQWRCEHPGETFSIPRAPHVLPRFQDRFIILSNGWYSDVAPDLVGLPDAAWRNLSIAIRREHECAHYWTRRVLSTMRASILDEIVADYCGMLAACGRFRADWLLAFFGLERYPAWRESGRLKNYRGTPPLSDAAFAIVQKMVVAAADNLEQFDRGHAHVLSGGAGILLALIALTQMTLEDLACQRAPELLARELTTAARIAADAVGRHHAAS